MCRPKAMQSVLPVVHNATAPLKMALGEAFLDDSRTS